jgi:hypothetical protein
MAPTDDESNVREALTTLGVGPAAKELYVDLLRPAAKELGGNLLTIARLITHALVPIQGMVWGLDRVRDWLGAALLKRLSSADPDDIETPPVYIAGQILLQLPFCAEQAQLRELYANLLASAMLKSRQGSVHPAFVQVIQQLSPDEALILQTIAEMPRALELRESLDEDGGITFGSEYISGRFRRICESAGTSNPDFSAAYLDNLLRLKVFEEHHWTLGRLEEHSWRDEKQLKQWTARLVQVSAFGERFIETVVPATGGA